jgi:enoyl-CoA hydratase
MPWPSYETLKIELDDRILTVTLDRPRVLNALNSRMGLDVIDVWSRVAASADEVRVVILTGAGMSDAEWRAQHDIFERAFGAILESPAPVIAAVNGHAFGGGLEMTLAADFAYGVASARFALTEVTIGIMPGGGGTQTLPRAVGGRRAKELILTGRAFSAAEALEWGVLNRVCEPGDLMPAARETAAAIARNAPLSVRQAKKSIEVGLEADLRTGLRYEIEAYNFLVPTEDRREGIRAFVEKRKPEFHGR